MAKYKLANGNIVDDTVMSIRPDLLATATKLPDTPTQSTPAAPVNVAPQVQKPVTTVQKSPVMLPTPTSNTQPLIKPTASPSLPVPTATPTMDNMSFMNLLNGVEQKLKYNNTLMSQRQLLIKHLFDSPLTPEELAKLPADVQKVVNSGDKNQIELQLRVMNDDLQGRSGTLDQSIKYITDAYKTEQDSLDKKRADAQKIIEDALTRSGSMAFKGYPPEVKRQLEQTAGYPAGYLDQATPSISEQRFLGGTDTGTTVNIPDPTSIAGRTNNPLNIKFSATTSSFGATDSGIPGQDGGTFSQFSTPEQGLQAGIQLLQSPVYSNLTVDQAMNKWSNNGYGAEVSSIPANTKISDMSTTQLNTLVGDMARRESGTTVSQTTKTPTSQQILNNTRLATIANKVSSNYVKMPIVKAVAGASIYLAKIESAMEGGAVPDEEILDSLVLLNKGGGQVTEGQISLIMKGRTYSDQVTALMSKFTKGGSLAPEERQQALELARKTYQKYTDAYKPIYDEALKKYQAYGGTEDMFTMASPQTLSSVANTVSGVTQDIIDNTALIQQAKSIGEMPVKNLQTGEIGTIPASEYDPSLYFQIEE